MDYAAPARIPRFYRRQNIPLNDEVDPAPASEPEPRRENMGRAHRFFHRRAAHGNTRVVTVAVEVIATVDTNGKVVAEETLAPVTPHVSTAAATAGVPASPSVRPPAQQPLPSVQLPAVPAVPTVALPVVPAVPTVPVPVLPSVPAVPPFPSDLTVPGYPFSTGVPASPEAPSASPVPTGGPGSTVPNPVFSSIHAGNSTESSTALSLFVSLGTSASTSALTPTSTELVASVADAPTSSQSLPSSSLSSSLRVSKSSTSTSTSTSASAEFSSASRSASPDASTAVYYGGGGGNAPTATSSAPASTSLAAAASSPSPLETPQVVGSIVGSLAGAALILALILLLLRRHKRKRGGALQLTGDDHTDAQSVRQAPASSSLVPAAFLHRFSAMSGKTGDTTTSAGERSFQRVSGRKLPSAFSEGMTSEQFAGGSTMSGSSFYQDEHGVYGGPGLSKEFGKEIGDTSLNRESGPMNIRPSPAKTPVIRHPDDGNPFSDRNYLSPSQSPNTEPPPRGTLGRSLPSADGSRSSRFTENV